MTLKACAWFLPRAFFPVSFFTHRHAEYNYMPSPVCPLREPSDLGADTRVPPHLISGPPSLTPAPTPWPPGSSSSCHSRSRPILAWLPHHLCVSAHTETPSVYSLRGTATPPRPATQLCHFHQSPCIPYHVHICPVRTEPWGTSFTVVLPAQQLSCRRCPGKVS